MFAGILNVRSYIVIALGTAGVLYLLNLLAGPSFLELLNGIERDAVRAGMSSGLADFVVEPLKFIFQPDSFIGPILAGVFWPLGAVWFLLMILLIIFSVLTPALNQAADPIRLD
jgi:hypothetical protein